MKQLILLSIICIFVMCSPKTTVQQNATTVNKNNYEELSDDAKLSSYVDKKVTFLASRCKMEYQHMLKLSIDGTPSYICLDAEVGQLLAYYQIEPNMENREKEFRVYGTVGTISGAGKGGGTHTEYYLDLDAVE